MKKAQVVRSYYVLPCCLLLLNLANSLISYKAGLIADPWVRTTAIILLVLASGTFAAYALAPAIEALVRLLHRGSRRSAGRLGELAFLLALGAGVFWLYYQLNSHGPEAILPRELWNHPVKH